MDTPLVSILINNYNYGRYVGIAIDSALNQTYSNIEIIVVDDGSTDNSREILATYESRAVVVYKENGGQASAFNAGFSRSSGEIVCFLDADDTFAENKVEHIVRTFTKPQMDDTEYVFDKVLKVDESLEPLNYTSRTNEVTYTNLTAPMVSGSLTKHQPFMIPATSGLSFKRGLLNEIFPIPESESCSMCENYMKYIAVGVAKGAFLDTTLTMQRIHGNNLFTNEMRDISMDARISILTGYWMGKNFPQLHKYANTQLALGYSFSLKAKPISDKYTKIIKQYFSSLTIAKKCLFLLRTCYYYVTVASRSTF